MTSEFSLGIKFNIKGSRHVKKNDYFLEHTDGRSAFYNIKYKELFGCYIVTISYGKIGTNGDSKEKHFSSELAARKFISTKKSEKLGKGYKEIL